MAYNPNNSNGQATAANSAPVVVASDQAQDLFITGAATAGSGNNLLLASAGTAAIDTLAGGATSYRSGYMQLVGSASLSGGGFLLEMSNDNSAWFGATSFDMATTAWTPTNSTYTVSANASRFIAFPVLARYVRFRVNAAPTAGTVQVFAKLSQHNLSQSYQWLSSSNSISTTTALTAPTNYHVVTTASTNAANVSGAKTLSGITISNTSASAAYVKIYNKSTSPTVGTDVPVMTIPVAATSTYISGFGAYGLRLSVGVGIAVTGAVDATDTTNGPAGVQINLSYV